MIFLFLNCILISALDISEATTATGVRGVVINQPAISTTSTFHPDAIATVEGTLDSGDINSVQTAKDGDTYNVSEVAGANPLLITVNFSGVTSFNSIIYRVWYEGGAGHQIDICLWDYDGSDWECEYGSITDMDEFGFDLKNVLDSTDHVSTEGLVQLKFDHINAGNINHNLFIDYVGLLLGASTISVAETDPLSIHKSGDVALTGNWNAGAFSITSGTTLQAEHLYSTDDAYITDRLGVGASTPESRIELAGTTDAYLTMHNTQDEDIEDGRETRIIFKGDRSGGEEHTLAQIEGSHGSAGDTNLGQLVFSTNNGAGLQDWIWIGETGQLLLGRKDGTGTIEVYNPVPDLDLVDSVDSNAHGSREGRVLFRGKKADGTEHTLTRIDGEHFGAGDDQIGSLSINLNDGDDGDSPQKTVEFLFVNTTIFNDLKVDGDITANNYFGDGSALTGIAGGSAVGILNDSEGNLSVYNDAGFVEINSSGTAKMRFTDSINALANILLKDGISILFGDSNEGFMTMNTSNDLKLGASSGLDANLYLGDGVNVFGKVYIGGDTEVQNLTAETPIYVSEPTRRLRLYDTDFLNSGNFDNPPFGAASIATGTKSGNVGTSESPGRIILVSKVGVANSGFAFGIGASALVLSGGEEFDFVFTALVNSATYVKMGFQDSGNANPPLDGAYCEYSNTAFSCNTTDNSVRSGTSIYTITHFTDYRLKGKVNDDASQVDFYLFTTDGTLVWSESLTTNIPTARPTGFSVLGTNSGIGASTNVIQVDYMGMQIRERRLGR